MINLFAFFVSCVVGMDVTPRGGGGYGSGGGGGRALEGGRVSDINVRVTRMMSAGISVGHGDAAADDVRARARGQRIPRRPPQRTRLARTSSAPSAVTDGRK